MADIETPIRESNDEGAVMEEEEGTGDCPEIDVQPAHIVISRALVILDVGVAAIFLAPFTCFVGFDGGPAQWTLALAACMGVSLLGVFLLLSGYALWKNQRTNLNGLLAWTRNLSISLGLVTSLLTAFPMALGALSSCGAHCHWFQLFYHVARLIMSLLCLLAWCLLPRMVRPYVSSSLEECRHTRPVRHWVALLWAFLTFVAPLCIFWTVA